MAGLLAGQGKTTRKLRTTSTLTRAPFRARFDTPNFTVWSNIMDVETAEVQLKMAERLLELERQVELNNHEIQVLMRAVASLSAKVNAQAL